METPSQWYDRMLPHMGDRGNNDPLPNTPGGGGHGNSDEMGPVVVAITAAVVVVGGLFGLNWAYDRSVDPDITPGPAIATATPPEANGAHIKIIDGRCETVYDDPSLQGDLRTSTKIYTADEEILLAFDTDDPSEGVEQTRVSAGSSFKRREEAEFHLARCWPSVDAPVGADLNLDDLGHAFHIPRSR